MILRDATESDVEPLARLHIASWQAAYRGILPDEVLDNLSLKKRSNLWRQLIADPNCTIVLALDENKLVGFTSFYPARDEHVDSSRVAELTTCYVHADYWRRGIGTALWNAVHRRMRGQFAECVLWVFRDNHPARRFYEWIGFAFDGTEQATQSVAPSPIEVRYRRLV